MFIFEHFTIALVTPQMGVGVKRILGHTVRNSWNPLDPRLPYRWLYKCRCTDTSKRNKNAQKCHSFSKYN